MKSRKSASRKGFLLVISYLLSAVCGGGPVLQLRYGYVAVQHNLYAICFP
jgi:hypothetical protein